MQYINSFQNNTNHNINKEHVLFPFTLI